MSNSSNHHLQINSNPILSPVSPLSTSSPLHNNNSSSTHTTSNSFNSSHSHHQNQNQHHQQASISGQTLQATNINSDPTPHNEFAAPLGITPNLTQSEPEQLTLPTVLIHYKNLKLNQTRSVKARIDRNVPLNEVIRQLCHSNQLSITEPSEFFALRDNSNNELITSENVFRKIESGQSSFKLVKSPKVEAKELVEKLVKFSNFSIQQQQPLNAPNYDDQFKAIKLSLFSLKDYLRESDYLNEFQDRGGDRELLKLCQTSTGNTLAYALSAFQVLLDQSTLDQRKNWEPNLADRLSNLLVSSTTPINVLRPTSAILRKFIAHDSSTGPRTTFLAICTVIEAAGEHEDLLGILSRRISSGSTGDFALAHVSLELVNVLMRPNLWEDGQNDNLGWFMDRIERSGMRRAVVKLSEGRADEAFDEVETDVLTFQRNIAIMNRKLIQITVNSEDAEHVEQLMEMAGRARELDQLHNSSKDENDDSRAGEDELEARKWKTLGFDSANLLDDFERVGVLGLKLMYRFMSSHLIEFDKFITEQLVKPDSKRCPFAKASNKCVEILAEIYEWNVNDTQPENQMTVYRPFMLYYSKLHHLSLDFFKLMWNESGATTHDFERVGVLVRSHLKHALRNHENLSKKSFKSNWLSFIKEFENVEYTKVRDRQMQELAMEDSMWNKPPVRNLRSKLYQDAFEFVKTQRINALLIGSWFPHYLESSSSAFQQQPSIAVTSAAISTIGSKLGLSVPNARNGFGSINSSRSPVIPSNGNEPNSGPFKWRFYRLAPNRKYLHFLESNQPIPIRNGVDEMPDRIDVSLITAIISGSGSKLAGETLLNFENNPHSQAPGEGEQQIADRGRNSSLSIRSNSSGSMTIHSPLMRTSKDHSSHHRRNHQAQSHQANAISLMNGGHLLLRLFPPNVTIFSEWLDGLNMLNSHDDFPLQNQPHQQQFQSVEDIGVMTTKESVELVNGLTQIGTMIKLLDLTGERIEVPSHVHIPPVPINSDFFYA
ncbi:hypothetical protein O181_044000 [Austropuccinia psidii MF-1]|uniref:ELMO domain-containing protein n=1 Tax=Austropuccinia psidii MF-1 TaxID=1389203 RepID=A0A9Q3DJA9_9BASI|nr:hypothetical protein [Austropuccinia psidii MF-1]